MPMGTTQWNNIYQKPSTKRIIPLQSPKSHTTQHKLNTHILHQNTT